VQEEEGTSGTTELTGDSRLSQHYEMPESHSAQNDFRSLGERKVTFDREEGAGCGCGCGCGW
jgi:hypothetical protein